MINDVKEKIIKLIYPFMVKSYGELSIGYFTDFHTGEKEYYQLLGNGKWMNLSTRSEYNLNIVNTGFIYLGCYDITSVLKYIIKNIENKNFGYVLAVEYIIVKDYNDIVTIEYKIPNKPLHLYTNEENTFLLKLLTNLS